MRLSGMAWAEGQDGQHPIYRERLYPNVGVWLVVWFVIGSISVAYGYAFGSFVAALIAVAGVGASSWALIATSPVIQVDELVLRAGVARIPREYVATVAVLDREASRAARSANFDPTAFSLLRTWSTATSIRCEINDPRDPHPSWLISTKRPHALASALTSNEPDLTDPLREADAVTSEHETKI